MTIEIRQTAAPRMALGVCLVLAGVGLTLESLHVLQPGKVVQYWPLGLVILGVSVALETRRPSDGPASSASSSWPIAIVLGVFFLLSQAFEHRGEAVGDTANGGIRMYAVMGGSHAVSHSSKFIGGEMTSFMGGSDLNLRQATIAASDEAVVDLNVLMGGAVIRVPEGWKVDTDTLAVLGGVDDQRRDRVAKNALGDGSTRPPRLTLRGHVVMGGVVIKN